MTSRSREESGTSTHKFCSVLFSTEILREILTTYGHTDNSLREAYFSRLCHSPDTWRNRSSPKWLTGPIHSPFKSLTPLFSLWPSSSYLIYLFLKEEYQEAFINLFYILFNQEKLLRLPVTAGCWFTVCITIMPSSMQGFVHDFPKDEEIVIALVSSRDENLATVSNREYYCFKKSCEIKHNYMCRKS